MSTIDVTLTEVAASLVLVTHDFEQAERLADWFVELEAGRVREAGEVLAR